MSGKRYMNLEERLQRQTVRPAQGCWTWTACHTRAGYAVTRHQKKLHYVHRLMYERFVGPISEGLVIDHLCRNRGCVNPDHLEAVTQSKNVARGLRGFALTGTCYRGIHDMTDAINIYVYGDGRRECDPCRRSRKGYTRA